LRWVRGLESPLEKVRIDDAPHAGVSRGQNVSLREKGL